MNQHVLAVGEVLCDLLPDQARAGGAPANFAFHAHALGASVQVISRVGNDEIGRELLGQLERAKIDCRAIQVDHAAPTGTARVELSAAGVPTFHIVEDVAWDRIATPADAIALRTANLVYFGTLAQRASVSRKTIRTILATVPQDAFRLFDVNLRAPYWTEEIILWSFNTANVVKLSEEELGLIAPMLKVTGSMEECMATIGQRWGLRALAITRGAQGSILWTPRALVKESGKHVDVCDTVGAGDAYTAVLAVGLLQNWPPERIVHEATEVAAFVCTQPGAMPFLPEEIRQRLNPMASDQAARRAEVLDRPGSSL